MSASFKRSGLHRLTCDSCPCYGYLTVATLESIGELPQCLSRACEGTLQPTTLGLAMHLGADDSVPMREYQREVNSVAKGQASHYAKGHKCDTPEAVAVERMTDRRAADARARRMAGIGLREIWTKPERPGERKQRRVVRVSTPEALPF